MQHGADRKCRLERNLLSVTRLKVSKVRSGGWAAELKATELPVGINPGTLGDTVTSGSRLALPQSNLDRSTMHKWSNDPRTVHKLVTYSVTMLSGTLGAIPLRVPRTRARARATEQAPLPLSPSFLPASSSFHPSFVFAKLEMYPAVTLPPLNPSEWAVPPWRTYRTNFAPVHDAARSLKGMKAVYLYTYSRQATLGAASEIYLSRLTGRGPVSPSTILYGLYEENLLLDSCAKTWKYGCDELS